MAKKIFEIYPKNDKNGPNIQTRPQKAKIVKLAVFRKGPDEIFSKSNENTGIYLRNDNLKRTGQLPKLEVESGFGTGCGASHRNDTRNVFSDSIRLNLGRG